MKITHISFSGAGMSGLVNLGILRYLQMERLDTSILSIAGTSMGAFFGCVLALGIPAGTMENDMKQFFSTPKSVFFEAASIMRIFQDLGMDHATITTILLEKYFMKLWGTLDVTFLDFAKTTGKDLVICASCIETGKAEYFSVNRTPDVSVLTAIQASMAVPMVFKPVKIGDYHYVDGGVTDNQPVDCFGEKARESMLAVKYSVTDACAQPSQAPLENVVSYFLHLMQMSFRYWDRQYEKAKYHIFIDKAPLGFLPCEYSKEGVCVKLTEQDIDRSVEHGFHKAFKFFQSSSCGSCDTSNLENLCH